MNLIKNIARIPISQIKNLLKLIQRSPVQYPSLGSMTLDEDDIEMAKKWLKSSEDLNAEDVVKEYHKFFAEWNGSKYVYSFMSAREALTAAIFGLGIKRGDEVVLPGYTCVVVPNAFIFEGIKITYVDIELDTYGIDVSCLSRMISKNTRAVLLHHLYGLVSRDYEKIINLCRENNIFIIEDCAQSTGAIYKNKKVGNLGDVAIYSSEQSKVFNTLTGGILSTNDSTIASKIREVHEKWLYPEIDHIRKQLVNIIINYYSYKNKYRWLLKDVIRVKYPIDMIVTTTKDEIEGKRSKNYGRKMPGAIASLGIIQLKKIDYYNSKRLQNSKIWDDWCNTSGFKGPSVINDSIPIYLRYPILVDPAKKNDLKWAWRELNIVPGVWYISNIHPGKQMVQNCPNADTAVKKCINMPTLFD